MSICLIAIAAWLRRSSSFLQMTALAWLPTLNKHDKKKPDNAPAGNLDGCRAYRVCVAAGATAKG